jgi:hypothetical protein
MAVQGVKGDRVSAAVEPGFPLFTQIGTAGESASYWNSGFPYSIEVSKR